jgi:predicted lactoylglutathione lyase
VHLKPLKSVREAAMVRVAEDSGVHICLRAPDTASVDAFHAAALKAGGASDGPPGPRPHYYEWYYAAFIREPDGSRIEAVTFLRDKAKLRRTSPTRPPTMPRRKRRATPQLRWD